MEVSSRFTSHEFVSTFRKVIKVSGARDENRVMVDPAIVDEYVTTVNTQEPHYFYMYTHVLQTLNLWLPFSSFESQVMTAMNVAPRQLYPNSWAFVKAFEVVCNNLNLVPTVMGSSDLIARETNPNSLGEYLSSMSTLSNEARMTLVLKAREEKAKAAAAATSTDFLSQLVIDKSGPKGSKRKNQEDSKRITIEIPKKKTANAEEEGDNLEEPFRRKKMPRSRGLPPPHSSGSSQSHADLEAVTKDAAPFINCCPANPKKKNKKGNSPPSFWAKDFDSLSFVDEGFKKYVNPSPLTDVSSDDLRKTSMDHHVQDAMLSYFLSSRQELELIEARNKMKTVDEHLASLEKEYAATKTKLKGDIKEMRAGRDEAVKEAVKVKEGEWAEEKKVFVDEEVDALATKVGNLELDLGSQYDDGFKYVVEQMKVVFPEVEAAKLGELDALN
ncbi:hypothetical protein TSUD_279940 [Trifolium subterraneum]|uniref:Uncharacterized protein n=1 Tax=Trifolium subterraneum TaxID=3900 RepID=A0A2Z6N2B2_TRISU|nr:hypothetical protein TSUD_279940 [Trifolium subterraneum]